MKLEYSEGSIKSNNSKDWFNYRIDSTFEELTLRNKLGCMDASVPINVVIRLSEESKKRYRKAREEYNNRYNALMQLKKIIKEKVDYRKVVNGRYLYELWIERIYRLDWVNGNPIEDINILSNELLINNDINPFDIELDPSKIVSKNIFNKIFKK